MITTGRPDLAVVVHRDHGGDGLAVTLDDYLIAMRDVVQQLAEIPPSIGGRYPALHRSPPVV